MHPSFTTLIDSFLADRIGIADQFLTTALSAHLADNLKALYAGAQMQHAGTGNAKHASKDKAVRGDMIYWLDRDHQDAHENAFFEQMDSFVAHLNETCYTGITGYEFHYALYPEGSFYRRHLDQFRSNTSRKYSMITYLNPDWQPSHGGELSIHQHGTH